MVETMSFLLYCKQEGQIRVETDVDTCPKCGRHVVNMGFCLAEQ